MASEIRVNRLSNRSGLSTITFANGGVQFSGITTFANGEFYVGTGATIINPGTNEFNFHTGGSNRFTINNSGANLGTGNITAVDATFTGNVSIGKTLTYEDVKNVDSVGVVTARTGVKITGGDLTVGTAITASSVTGNVTQDVGITTFSGSAVWFKGATANKDMYWSHASGATVYKDNAQILMGDSSDLQIFHAGGTANKIKSGANTLYIAADDLQITNKEITEPCLKTFADGAVEIYYDNAKKIETSSYGTWLGDNSRITLGGSAGTPDCHFYADSNNTNLQNITGDLIIKSNSDGDKAIVVKNGAATELYYDNAKKIETTNTGIDVVGAIDLTGTATSNDVSNGGMYRHSNAYTYFSGKSDGSGAVLSSGDGTATVFCIRANSSQSYIKMETGNGSEKLRITSAGDVCINRTAPLDSAKLSIQCDATEPAIGVQCNHTNTDTKLISAWNSGAKNIVNITAESDNSPYLKFEILSGNSPVERFRVNHLGNVSIGGGTAPNRLEIIDDPQGFPSDSAQPNATLLIKHGTSGSNRRWVGIGASLTGAWIQSSSPGGSGLAAPLWINKGGGEITLGNEKLRITSGGFLLLGTTDTGFSSGYTNMTIGNASTQNTGLTIASSPSNGYSRVHFADANSGNAKFAGWIAYGHSEDMMMFSAGNSGSSKMNLDSSGNLAINKTSGISAKLHIGDTSNDGALSQLVKLGNDSSGSGTGAQLNMGAGSANESTAACIGGFYDGTGTSFIIKTTGTYANQGTVAERFRIKNDGETEFKGQYLNHSGSGQKCRTFAGSITLGDGAVGNIMINNSGYTRGFFEVWIISYHGSIGRAHWTGEQSRYSGNDNYVNSNSMGYCTLDRYQDGVNNNGIRITRTGTYGNVTFNFFARAISANATASWSSSYTKYLDGAF